MAHHNREGEPPLWLDIALQPGVFEILTALLDRGGSLAYSEICACLGQQRPGVTVRALRRLGACGLLQSGWRNGGSWDEPKPSTRFELTWRGHGYAQTLDNIGRWAARNLVATRTQSDSD